MAPYSSHIETTGFYCLLGIRQVQLYGLNVSSTISRQFANIRNNEYTEQTGGVLLAPAVLVVCFTSLGAAFTFSSHAGKTALPSTSHFAWQYTPERATVDVGLIILKNHQLF